MNATTGRSWLWQGLAAVGLVAAGAGGMYILMPRHGAEPPAGAAAPAATADPGLAGEVAVILAPDALTRIGLKTTPVREGAVTRRLRLPGVIEPHAYRQVAVTALAAGQVTSVRADLGSRVAVGDVMAEIFSPELAETERAFIGMRAELEAVTLRVARLERLVEIGAGSQQELEAVRAEATRFATEVEGARARLLLLGVSADRLAALSTADQIAATMPVFASSAGVVTQRMVNRGQNVEAAAPLFTVVDLGTVWAIGDVYERDVTHVRVGLPVTLTSTAVPGTSWAGRVSYIDPEIAAGTRTTRVRVEVANPGERLRLGMFVEMTADEVTSPSARLVPREAVQTIGAHTVVYVPDTAEAGRFVERVVGLGGTSGDLVEIVAGLDTGTPVVTTGSFYLRAERERLGLPPPVATAPPAAAPAASGSASRGPAGATPPASPAVRHAISVTALEFSPSTITVDRGVPVELVFLREAEESCGTEVVFPALDIRRELPLGQPVLIRFMPDRAGPIAFTCGMNMLRGSVVVR